MAGKKVSFGRKPGAEEKPIELEAWVANREALVETEPTAAPQKSEPEKIKRLTLDIPESLHRSIKLKATREGVTMVELLRQLLEAHYGTED
jgi:predicted DNA binding CopG/RHH family protein